MNLFQPAIILSFAYLAVFGEATLSAPRSLFGTQIDLLPALMLYAALNAGLVTVALLAVVGGLWFDSLSANPLGVTILPLLAVGFPIYLRRDLILRDAPFAQFVLGAAASAVVPALTVLILFHSGRQPLIGWGSLWQWLVLTAGGAAATPVMFAVFQRCGHLFGYKLRTETSFRDDREIHRGRK